MEESLGGVTRRGPERELVWAPRTHLEEKSERQFLRLRGTLIHMQVLEVHDLLRQKQFPQ